MTASADAAIPLWHFWQPRYWPVWLGLGVLRLLVWLPHPARRVAGRGLGKLAYRVLPGRRAIAATNLRLCFPELSDSGRHALLLRHFASLGMSVVELGMSWWASDEELRRLVRMEGLEHLQRATASGKGAIILSGHFGASEFAGRIVKGHFPQLAGLYRPNRNAMVDEFLRRGRSRSVLDLIAKDNVRALLRRLSQGISVWYAPDQSYRRSYSVLVPFFGVPAMTNAALTHLTRISGAPVVPFSSRRLPDGSYVVTFEPALEGFPTGDLTVDATRVNALLESVIRRAPEEYYWIHRRFKGRPEEYPDPYR
jgi:KDO2-lipid IV(A) lauroyltransferase